MSVNLSTWLTTLQARACPPHATTRACSSSRRSTSTYNNDDDRYPTHSTAQEQAWHVCAHTCTHKSKVPLRAFRGRPRIASGNVTLTDQIMRRQNRRARPEEARLQARIIIMKAEACVRTGFCRLCIELGDMLSSRCFRTYAQSMYARLCT